MIIYLDNIQNLGNIMKKNRISERYVFNLLNLKIGQIRIKKFLLNKIRLKNDQLDFKYLFIKLFL
jgi:hypothetical protein